MNAINSAGLVNGFPATAVIRLTGDRPVSAVPARDARADEVILAAVQHPPRIGEARPIAALMPDVLARYGLTAQITPGSFATYGQPSNSAPPRITSA